MQLWFGIFLTQWEHIWGQLYFTASHEKSLRLSAQQAIRKALAGLYLNEAQMFLVVALEFFIVT